eukprot:765555-Hanusia_phi.AAC.1
MTRTVSATTEEQKGTAILNLNSANAALPSQSTAILYDSASRICTRRSEATDHRTTCCRIACKAPGKRGPGRRAQTPVAC